LFDDPTSVITIPSDVTVSPTSLEFNVTEANRDNFYVVKVTDRNMCEFITPVQSFDFPETPFADFDKDDIICASDTGSFTIETPTSGVGPFTYAIFEGTTRPTPEPADLFNDPAINNTTTQTSNVQRTYTYIIRDRNGCESDPRQVTINDNSISGAIDDTPVTCVGMPPTNDNGTIILEILRGRTNFVYTIFDADDIPVFPAPRVPLAVGNNFDATTDETETTASRTITFIGLSEGGYEIQVVDADPGVGCGPVSFFRRVRSASPIDIADPIYTDCVASGGNVTALFRISSENLPFIESPSAGGAPIDPSISTADDVFRYTDLTGPEQAALNTALGFTPNVGTEGTYYGVTGLAANRPYNLEVIDSVTLCNDILELDAEENLVRITDISLRPDSDCSSGVPVVEGQFVVTFEVNTPGPTLFDVTLLDQNNNPIGATINNVPVAAPVPAIPGILRGTQTFSNLPVGRYKVRVDEPGGQCGAESGIEELILAPQLELPMAAEPLVVGCGNNPGDQTATITVSASGGILFDPSDVANGYLFALVPAGTGIPTFVSATDPGDDFEDRISFERDPAVNTSWELWVKDNSSCIAVGPVAVMITPNTTPVITAEPFSANQCNGPTFPVEVSITNYETDLAPYTFKIFDDAVTPNEVVANAGSIDNTFTPATAITTLTIPSRGAFNIEVTDINGCNTSIPFIVYEELEVSATVGTVECDDTITQVEANVTGGFINATVGREIFYELFIEGNPTVVNTSNQVVAANTATPTHIFTEDNAANPLQAGVRYFKYDQTTRNTRSFNSNFV